MEQKSKGRISVEEMSMSVKKGLYQSESLLENNFSVSAGVEYYPEDLKPGEYLDYAVLADILKSNILKNNHLLEKVAKMMLDEIRQQWPVAISVHVTIKKLHPHFEHPMSAVKVELIWVR